MTSSDSQRDRSSDERFERLLIDSARSDELPRNVDAAWNKFGAALNGVSLLGAGAGGELAVQRAQRWLAAKWLIWGMLSGSALTALSLRAIHDRRAAPSAALSAPTVVPAAKSSAPAPPTEHEVERGTAALRSPLRAELHSTRPRTAPARGEAAPPPRPGGETAALSRATSTLSEQVALLDAARSASASGDFAEALHLADRYRVDFPGGELAPEAEVVAIEALVGRAERQAALARAAHFLARYPGDPHTSRVKWLVR